MIMLAVWLLLVVTGFVEWTLRTPASQGRLLYPALAAVALVLVVGWAELIPQRLRRPVGGAALVVWLAWAALCPLLVIKPAYALPERVARPAELSFEPSLLRVRYDDCCELVGYGLPEEPAYPGERVPLRLIWQGLEAMDQAHSLFVHAITANGQLVGQLDTYHGGGMYPTSQWQPGELIDDVVYVPLSWHAQGPALLHFSVGLHEAPTMDRFPAYAPDGQEVDVVLAGEAALLPFQWPEAQRELEVDAVFEEKIRLAGFEVPETASPGEVVTVTLQWEALDRVTEDYTGFVHLVDSSGSDIVQDDHVPVRGSFPTRLWPAGAMISDPYQLELPEDLPEGSYGLWIGLYRPASGQRLQAVSLETSTRWKDDLVPIGTLVVGADGERPPSLLTSIRLLGYTVRWSAARR
jgi:hypothetical protein